MVFLLQHLMLVTVIMAVAVVKKGLPKASDVTKLILIGKNNCAIRAWTGSS